MAELVDHGNVAETDDDLFASYSDFDWSDLTPVPQNDGPNPVVPINYSPQFVRLMDLFRALVLSGEYSERALFLTEELLDVNAGNYTVWQYRRECLRRLPRGKLFVQVELQFMDNFASENPKNYQIWFHRRAVAEILATQEGVWGVSEDQQAVETVSDKSREIGQRELKFCAKVLDIDNKNYHAWAHRQWAISTFDQWAGELEYIEKMISLDVRNNSAWNQRWFVVMNPENPKNKVFMQKNYPDLAPQRPGGARTAASLDVLQGECTFAFSALATFARGNESAWNYLRGLAGLSSQFRREHELFMTGSEAESSGKDQEGRSAAVQRRIQELDIVFATVRDRCAELVASTEGGNVLALGLLVDLRETDWRSRWLLSSEQRYETEREAERNVVCAMLQALAELDGIRAKSWLRRLRSMRGV